VDRDHAEREKLSSGSGRGKETRNGREPHGPHSDLQLSDSVQTPVVRRWRRWMTRLGDEEKNLTT
jgi:hypothetical protein